MKKNLIEEMLAIEGKAKRQRTMIEYAKSLKVNVTKAVNEDGSLDEDHLVVLIYDAQQLKISQKNRILGVIFGALIFIFIIGGLMFVFGSFVAPSIEEKVFIKE